MEAWLQQARRRFHAKCLAGPISETNGVPSIADVSNKASREISKALLAKIGTTQSHVEKPAGQTAGNMFESACQTFIADCFGQLAHLRPGTFDVERGQAISKFDQYSHLDELRLLADASRELKTHLGTDYLIKPDVVVIRAAESDDNINRNMVLVDDTVARHTALRVANGANATLHASISCKLTIRSDRVQNTRSEALGTGDMDCVYHFALPELVETLREQGRETLELVETMIEGQRLRDVADLPLDLTI